MVGSRVAPFLREEMISGNPRRHEVGSRASGRAETVFMTFPLESLTLRVFVTMLCFVIVRVWGVQKRSDKITEGSGQGTDAKSPRDHTSFFFYNCVCSGSSKWSDK